MRLFKFVFEHKIALLIVFVLLAVQALLELALPTFTSNIVDVGIATCVDEQGNLHLDYILQTGALMMLTTIGILTTSLLANLTSSLTGAKIGRDLREKLFAKITEFSKAEIDEFSGATLITRGTNDIQNIQMACVLGQRMLLYAPVLAFGGIFMVSQMDLSMVWIIVLGVVVVVVSVLSLMRITMPKFTLMQKLVDRVNLVARETLTGLPVIRAFCREKYEEQRFDSASKQLRDTQLFTNRVMTFMMPIMMLVMNLMSVVIVWVGGHAINDGTLQTGEMIAYITYSMIIVSSFLMFGMVAIFFPRANVAANRVWEVITREPSVRDGGEGVRKLRENEGTCVASAGADLGELGLQEGVAHSTTCVEDPDRVTYEKGFAKTNQTNVRHTLRHAPFIEFDHVNFAYAEATKGAVENVLDDVSFTANAGEVTAIVGTTGSGKSTIIHLIERFYDVSAGAVRVCGIDVRDMRLCDLRAKFGYVPQKVFLFTGTVESNVEYGLGESVNECELTYKNEHANMEHTNVLVEKTNSSTISTTDALDIAQASEFVNAMPKGLNSLIAQGGSNVSGGQRQRLAIARALATGAEAYIFDDSFSALDYKTDAELRSQMRKRLRDATVVIVAQRVATVMSADKIICVSDGKIAGVGTHAQLLRTCPEYYDIAASQLSLEELRESVRACTSKSKGVNTTESEATTAECDTSAITQRKTVAPSLHTKGGE